MMVLLRVSAKIYKIVNHDCLQVCHFISNIQEKLMSFRVQHRFTSAKATHPREITVIYLSAKRSISLCFCKDIRCDECPN